MLVAKKRPGVGNDGSAILGSLFEAGLRPSRQQFVRGGRDLALRNSDFAPNAYGVRFGPLDPSRAAQRQAMLSEFVESYFE